MQRAGHGQAAQNEWGSGQSGQRGIWPTARVRHVGSDVWSRHERRGRVCKGGVREVSRKRLGSASEVSRRCLGGVSGVSLRTGRGDQRQQEGGGGGGRAAQLVETLAAEVAAQVAHVDCVGVPVHACSQPHAAMPAVCGVLTQTDHDYGSSISTNGVGAPVVHRVPEHVGQVDLDRRRAEPLPALVHELRGGEGEGGGGGRRGRVAHSECVAYSECL